VNQATLSAAARRFLREDVSSLERLTVLLFLHRHAARWWQAQTLAEELEMRAEAVQSHLEHLAARCLLDVRITSSLFYCYKPGKEELPALVDEVARAHFLRHDAVAALLAGPASKARLFASAFQFRKGKRDG
jgi:hypothetical protein